MADPEKFELAIPSNTTVAQEVQERIIAELEKRDYTARDVFGVRLSLEEAITNAIRHGNGNDESLKVNIECEVSDDRLRVVVTDQGDGFTPSDVPDPTADENLELAGGRGVLLMEAYMSKVEYNEKGNQVILEKQRTVEPAE
ncbi:MAG: ATP-binding protein [Planctomycetaceae bacterium]